MLPLNPHDISLVEFLSFYVLLIVAILISFLCVYNPLLFSLSLSSAPFLPYDICYKSYIRLNSECKLFSCISPIEKLLISFHQYPRSSGLSSLPNLDQNNFEPSDYLLLNTYHPVSGARWGCKVADFPLSSSKTISPLINHADPETVELNPNCFNALTHLPTLVLL